MSSGSRVAGSSRTLAFAALVPMLALHALGCGGRAQIALDELPPQPDAAVPEVSLPDGSVLCRTDRDCDDAVTWMWRWCLRASDSRLACW